jgi:lysophospholipase L1-like esterase
MKILQILLIIVAIVAGLTAIAEIGLRLTQGLGNPPLYIADSEIGYLLAPRQKLRRFGNLLQINQYSMRHGEITLKKEGNIQRIFFLGDSVVNGSWWTDQANILSALLAQKLSASKSDRPVEVFNASTNSWGPRNELAYLKRYGLFDADILILVINTDDLWATEATSLVVGKSWSYPTQTPALALIELYQFYWASPQSIPELETLRAKKAQNLEANLAAIQAIKAIALESEVKFILALTPLLKELQVGSTAEEAEARQRLQNLVNAEKLKYFDFLQIWLNYPDPDSLYRDHIHPSPQGNIKIVEQLLIADLMHSSASM